MLEGAIKTLNKCKPYKIQFLGTPMKYVTKSRMLNEKERSYLSIRFKLLPHALYGCRVSPNPHGKFVYLTTPFEQTNAYSVYHKSYQQVTFSALCIKRNNHGVRESICLPEMTRSNLQSYESSQNHFRVTYHIYSFHLQEVQSRRNFRV